MLHKYETGEKELEVLVTTINPSHAEGVEFWCKKHNISFTNIKDIIKNNRVIDKFENEVKFYNSFFNDYEKIKIFKLIETSWSVDWGELTATMKLRRKNILEKYKNLYEEIYKS